MSFVEKDRFYKNKDGLKLTSVTDLILRLASVYENLASENVTIFGVNGHFQCNFSKMTSILTIFI